MKFTAMNPDEIQVGMTLKYNGNVFPGKEYKISEIFARGTNCDGKQYICGYHDFGTGSRISFSYAEGETHYIFSHLFLLVGV